ncbi:MAG: RNA polymerase sigma factor [Bacillota bacterium]|nr:RNA polymerase sigma factor [Bacillota bacterium]
MDLELIKKAKGGCFDSFGLAVFSIKDRAYRIAYSYLKNTDDSKDAVCDSIEKAFYGIKKLKQLESFDTWFIRIVINECKKKLREANNLLLEDYIDDIAEQNKEFSAIQIKLDLIVLLENLKPIDRSMIYMKYYIGYSLDEISKIVEMPLSTVKTRIYTALNKIRTLMREEGYTRESI